MSKQRILSAREQYELLHPWQKHAMPAPAPEGLRFEPGQARSENMGRVNAYVGDDPDHIGYLEWLDDGNPLSIVTDRKPGEVSHIWVNPPYRRQNVATEMYDWAKNNLRPDIHHSPRRTDLGEKWIQHEEARKQLTAAVRLDKLAMADTSQWHPRILQNHTPTDTGEDWGRYRILNDAGDGYLGVLDYDLNPESKRDNNPATALISSIFVHPNYRGQGIAQAMLERLHNDFPEHKINPGATSTYGNGLTEHLRKTIPGAEDALMPGYKPTVMSEERSKYYDRATQSRYDAHPSLVSASRKWASDTSPFADFFGWCAEQHLKPNHASLDQFAQVTGLDLEDYQDLSRLIEGMGLTGEQLEVLRVASQRFWAADTSKWHPQITHDKQDYDGMYRIHDEDGGHPIGQLDYSLIPAYDWDTDRDYDEAYISSLLVHPSHRGKGIGQALVERLHQDFPKHRIDPGGTTQMGHGFTEHLRKNIPGSEYKISPGYDPMPMDDDESADWTRQTMEREWGKPVMAQRFWAMAPAEDAYDENPTDAQRADMSMPLVENASGKWYHVSPYKMEPDTILRPGGGASPYSYNSQEMPTQRQRDWVWMDTPEAVKQWYYGTLLGQVQQGHENPWAYIYEVEPSEGPHPWNGTGQDGHVAPTARIVREIPTDKYNNFPDDLGHNKSAGKNGELPEDLKYKWYGVHPFLGDNWFEAEHNGKTVGRLYWNTEDHPRPGEISLVQVHPDYRRRGIATDMVNTVRDEIDPNIQYSSVVSPDGKAWSKANGYKPENGIWQNVKRRDDKAEWRE